MSMHVLLVGQLLEESNCLWFLTPWDPWKIRESSVAIFTLCYRKTEYLRLD